MPSDRRMFLGAGLGVTAALASRASGLTTAAQAVSSESPPRPGNISFEPELRAAAAHDFGRLIHGQPRGVLKPASSADIASLMRWVAAIGLLPIPGPVDEAALLLLAPILFVFYREPMREALRDAN